MRGNSGNSYRRRLRRRQSKLRRSPPNLPRKRAGVEDAFVTVDRVRGVQQFRHAAVELSMLLHVMVVTSVWGSNMALRPCAWYQDISSTLGSAAAVGVNANKVEAKNNRTSPEAVAERFLTCMSPPITETCHSVVMRASHSFTRIGATLDPVHSSEAPGCGSGSSASIRRTSPAACRKRVKKVHTPRAWTRRP